MSTKKNNIEMKLGLRSSFISTSFSIKIQNLKIDQRPKDHAYVIGMPEVHEDLNTMFSNYSNDFTILMSPGAGGILEGN